MKFASPAGGVSITGGSVTINGDVTLAAGTTVGVTGPVSVTGSSVSITGTPTVNLAAGSSVSITGTTSVAVTGTPTVNLATGSSVSITGTPTVNFAAGASVAITGTPSVTISGTPQVDLASGASVAITGTPTVDIAPGATVSVTTVENITGNVSIVNPSGSLLNVRQFSVGSDTVTSAGIGAAGWVSLSVGGGNAVYTGMNNVTPGSDSQLMVWAVTFVPYYNSNVFPVSCGPPTAASSSGVSDLQVWGGAQTSDYVGTSSSGLYWGTPCTWIVTGFSTSTSAPIISLSIPMGGGAAAAGAYGSYLYCAVGATSSTPFSNFVGNGIVSGPATVTATGESSSTSLPTASTLIAASSAITSNASPSGPNSPNLGTLRDGSYININGIGGMIGALDIAPQFTGGTPSITWSSSDIYVAESGLVVGVPQ